MRLPLPAVAMGAVVGRLLFKGLVGMAAYVLISFDAYLRPSETYRLTGDSLIPPVVGDPRHRRWGLIINNALDGRPGKTGVSDESVVVDWEPLWSILAALQLASPGRRCLWTFTPDQMRSSFKEAFDELGLWSEDPSLYRLRHGGASHDLLLGRRSLAEVKERGRWLADASLRRYGKRTRMQDRMNALPPEVRIFGQEILDRIVEMFNLAAVRQPCPIPFPAVRRGRRAPPVEAPALTHRWKFT